MSTKEACTLVAFAAESRAGRDGFERDEFGEGVDQFVCFISILSLMERRDVPLLIGGFSSWFMENSVKSQMPTVLSLPPVAYIRRSLNRPAADASMVPSWATQLPTSSNLELNFWFVSNGSKWDGTDSNQP